VYQLAAATHNPAALLAGTTPAASFQALYEQPSILGAMQFCRYFTSNAGLTLLHKAVGADKQQQQQKTLPCNSSSNTQPHQAHSEQQQVLRPFTLVVDSKGTGHAATLQAALDMAAAAAGQRAQQHYSSSSVADKQPAQAADSSGNATCSRRRSIEHCPLAADSCSASDVNVQASSESSSGTCSSAAACDNVLIVLLPGTYSGSHALPGNVRHITIAGIPGSKTLLCDAGSDQNCADGSPLSGSRGFLQGQQQLQQQSLQELDARMLRLQPAQRQAAAAPGQLLRSSSTSKVQGQQRQGSKPACLLSCPFGVESLKLQHLHMELAGAAGAHGAAQCQRVLMRQESAPASIGAVRGTSTSSSSSRLGSRLGSSTSAASSSKGQQSSAAEEAVESEPYCIRLCSGSELRMEWCEFSGGAGGVLSEAGAMVAAMQCSFHQ
jgi:hypothetical protein